ncbi:MAG TPA: glycosyltransferase family 4 protein [Kineosporiaceae bacterium]|nr:glycosyltransferase family 4 protein [Kineosporiaceae bacterium]
MSGSALRIAMLAPPWYDVPPEAYGGIEMVCGELADGLVEEGHKVRLLATGDCRTKAEFVEAGDRPEICWIGRSVPTIAYAAQAERLLRGSDVDLVHDHTEAGPLFAAVRDAPTVVTAHGPMTGPFGAYYRAIADGVHLVAISQAQRDLAPDLPWVGMVHNAVRVDDFPLPGERDDVVVFLGRASRDKGAHLAIDAARAAGLRILLAGKCTEVEEHLYFASEVKPRLGEDAQWLGEADMALKLDLLSRARCLLFPICWEEPFGMVMIEANACGTPVVALRRGSVPEVITDGVNGFVCDDPAELPEAVLAAERLDPYRCREHLYGRFDPPTLVSGYQEVYRQVLG